MSLKGVFDSLPLPGTSRLPSFEGATGWLNTGPLTRDDVHGKVVLVDFWTYTCINWIRTLPYVRAWAQTYGPHGLVVVGVHTPEFSIEHDTDSVRRAAEAMGVEYPIALDNDYAVWDAFANRYWPAMYIADADGRIRHHHFGEGGYERAEHVIRRLLADAGAAGLPEDAAPVTARDVEAEADWLDLHSPETYLGASRSAGFASPGGAAFDEMRVYRAPQQLAPNEWALAGHFTIRSEDVVANEPHGHITYRFHARDVNVILAPSHDMKPVRFRVLLDGRPPRGSRGLDVDEGGDGVVREPRMYQVIRQSRPIDDRELDIEFLDAGARAFCFTFG